MTSTRAARTVKIGVIAARSGPVEVPAVGDHAQQDSPHHDNADRPEDRDDRRHDVLWWLKTSAASCRPPAVVVMDAAEHRTPFETTSPNCLR